MQVEAERLNHHRKVFVSAVYEAEHPVVHVHPVSGEPALLLGHFVKKLVGLSTADSARLFEILQNRVIRLENTVRWSLDSIELIASGQLSAKRLSSRPRPTRSPS